MDMLAPNTSLALLNASQNNAKQSAQDLKAAHTLDKIEETARDFEAMFMAEMLKPMFEDIETDGPFGGGKGEEVFRSFMLQEYGKMIAETGQIGIADQVKTEMIRMQEHQTNQRSPQ